jgi:hypothetical protein
MGPSKTPYLLTVLLPHFQAVLNAVLFAMLQGRGQVQGQGGNETRAQKTAQGCCHHTYGDLPRSSTAYKTSIAHFTSSLCSSPASKLCSTLCSSLCCRGEDV